MMADIMSHPGSEVVSFVIGSQIKTMYTVYVQFLPFSLTVEWTSYYNLLGFWHPYSTVFCLKNILQIYIFK